MEDLDETITFYMIYCKDENIKDTYIGSTLNYTRRKWQHKKVCNDENEKGYNIARRTVAKYREQLGIPVARLRKEL